MKGDCEGGCCRAVVKESCERGLAKGGCEGRFAKGEKFWFYSYPVKIGQFSLKRICFESKW